MTCIFFFEIVLFIFPSKKAPSRTKWLKVRNIKSWISDSKVNFSLFFIIFSFREHQVHGSLETPRGFCNFVWSAHSISEFRVCEFWMWRWNAALCYSLLVTCNSHGDRDLHYIWARMVYMEFYMYACTYVLTRRETTKRILCKIKYEYRNSWMSLHHLSRGLLYFFSSTIYPFVFLIIFLGNNFLIIILRLFTSTHVLRACQLVAISE